MQNEPLVSVVIPFYNGREYIRDTLLSFVNQNYRNWECLLIDDYSPESAEDICRSLNDDRIQYIKNDGEKGMANARNKGCFLAQGELIALCDQDDISLPERLVRQVEVMQKDNELLLVGSWRRNFGANNHVAHHETDPETIKIRLLGNSQFTNPSVMFRKTLFSFYGLTFSQSMAPSDDYDFICKVALIGKISNIPEVLFLYRIHQKQVSVQKSHEIEQMAYQIRIKYIHALLDKWISFGFEPVEMADVFSGLNSQMFLSKKVYERFVFWSQLNRQKLLFEQGKWDSFLGERCLLGLQKSNLSIASRLYIVIKLFRLIFMFLKGKSLKSRMMFLITSIIR